jgi:hypothetical protein
MLTQGWSQATWATVANILIDACTPPTINPLAYMNTFLQTWAPPSRGENTARLGSDITRMLKVVKNHNANFAAIKLAPELQKKLPAWY